jgi:two-component system OmpR family response regulator
MRVLVVEDEVKLASLMRRGLREESIAADVAISGEDALWMTEEQEYDVVVLDVMLPGIDGFETCRQLRARAYETPIIMLTARDSVQDRIAGLDGGADDYLTKPFSFGELLARLRALARRGTVASEVGLSVGDLHLDPATHEARRGDTAIELTVKEFAMLEMFMRRPGIAMTRDQFLDNAWSYEFQNQSNVVDVYVRYLREKIDRPFGVTSLETVRGIGYRLRKDGGK